MLFAIFLLGLGTSVLSENCKGFFYDEKYYFVPEIIKEGITNIRGLAVSSKRNNALFFTYDYFDKNVKSKTAYITFDNELSHVIDINNTNTNAADYASDAVYIGAKDGIYQLDSNNVITKLSSDNAISMSVYNSELYYVDSKNEVYVMRYGIGTRLPVFDGVKVKKLVINPTGDSMLFITTNNKLGSSKKDDNTYVLHDVKANTVAVDYRGRFYFTTDDGIYLFNMKKSLIDKLVNLNGIQELSFIKGDYNTDNFDVDNYGIPVYAVSNSIVRLRPQLPCFE